MCEGLAAIAVLQDGSWRGYAEPKNGASVTGSDVLVGILCGLLIVAGTAIMLLFAASRGPWL